MNSWKMSAHKCSLISAARLPAPAYRQKMGYPKGVSFHSFSRYKYAVQGSADSCDSSFFLSAFVSCPCPYRLWFFHLLLQSCSPLWHRYFGRPEGKIPHYTDSGTDVRNNSPHHMLSISDCLTHQSDFSMPHAPFLFLY